MIFILFYELIHIFSVVNNCDYLNVVNNCDYLNARKLYLIKLDFQLEDLWNYMMKQYQDIER